MTKTIDMSVLSGQKIDCEFSELIGEAEPYYFDEVGYLKEIKDEIDPVFCNCRFINSSNNVGSRYCRPRLNHWHFNDGSMVLMGWLFSLNYGQMKQTSATKVLRTLTIQMKQLLEQ